jgi:hypothetical protein
VTASQGLAEFDEWLPDTKQVLLSAALSALSDSAGLELAEELQGVDPATANAPRKPQCTLDWVFPRCPECWRRYPRYARAWHDAHPRHVTALHERQARRVERDIRPLRRRIEIHRRNDCTDVDALQTQLDALLTTAQHHRDLAAAARALPDPPVPKFQALAPVVQLAVETSRSTVPSTLRFATIATPNSPAGPPDTGTSGVPDVTSRAVHAEDVASVIQNRIRPAMNQSVSNVLAYLAARGGEGHPTPDRVADDLKTPVRTLNDRLRRADMPALELLIGWHRLLHAIWRVERESRGLTDVVRAGGYSTDAAFQKALKRYSGRGLSELMSSGKAFTYLLEHFAGALERRQHVRRRPRDCPDEHSKAPHPVSP